MNPRVEKFISLLQKKYAINVAYKTNSNFMKILSKILFFVPDFQTKFTTTIGNTIYFPNEERLQNNSSLSLIAHEVRHIHDSQLDKLYNIKYLFPQILFLLFFILGFISPWMFLPALISLAPLPAYWRMKIELKGYTTTLFVYNLLLKEQDLLLSERLDLILEYAEKINKSFITSSYYFMWFFGVEKQLNENAYKILEEKLQKEDDFYLFIQESFDSSKLN